MAVTTGEFWQFSLTFYQNNLVSQRLLAAQEEHNLNINMALFCLYLEQKNLGLSHSQLEALKRQLQPFNQEVTNKLRSLRFEFRHREQEIDGYATLKKHLLQAELILEQQEQAILIATCQSFAHFEGEDSFNLRRYEALLNQHNSAKNNSTLKISDLNQYIN